MVINKHMLRRLSEPSTYAGLAVLATVFGLSDADWQTVSSALAGLFAVIAILFREGTRID